MCSAAATAAAAEVRFVASALVKIPIRVVCFHKVNKGLQRWQCCFTFTHTVFKPQQCSSFGQAGVYVCDESVVGLPGPLKAFVLLLFSCRLHWARLQTCFRLSAFHAKPSLNLAYGKEHLAEHIVVRRVRLFWPTPAQTFVQPPSNLATVTNTRAHFAGLTVPWQLHTCVLLAASRGPAPSQPGEDGPLPTELRWLKYKIEAAEKALNAAMEEWRGDPSNEVLKEFFMDAKQTRQKLLDMRQGLALGLVKTSGALMVVGCAGTEYLGHN
jgi:hypothetical protein